MGLELPGLGRAVVDSALFNLDFEHVLVDNGGHPVDRGLASPSRAQW